MNGCYCRSLSCLLVAITAASCLATPVSIPTDHSLHHALHHFEVLQKHHLEHRDTARGQKRLVFSTHGRKFDLNLSSRKGLLSEDVEVRSVGAGGEVRRHTLDHTHFFTGQVQGESGSKVTVHLDPKEGVLTASIHTNTDHYFIEPSHRHFHQPHDFHMISYRGSDLKYNITQKPSTSYCGTSPLFSPPPPPPLYVPISPPRRPSPSLLRRQATPLTRNTCPMLLVATGRFHQAYSGSLSVENTILFMVQVIDDIDQNIYRPVQWGTDILNFGLSIKNITVYETLNEGPEYNMDRGGGWESSRMLQLFSHNNWNDFCLAHLFAFQDFNDGLLGVAYPASEDNVPGGICSTAIPNFNEGDIATANVGLSSYRGGDGRVLLLAEARLITSHEIGHNWGSEHDPTNRIDVCNPEISNKAGKFLMFPSASDGTQPNNDNFSVCSIDFVSRVLLAKSQDCFIELESESLCGNYEVDDVDDEDEQCDAGLQGTLGLDTCCDEQCRLRAGKVCSDSNHVCCTNCSYSPTTKVCRSFPTVNSLCYGNVFCDGTKEVCPSEVPPLPVDSPCRGSGRCLYNGTVCSANNTCMDPPPNPFNKVECYDFCQLRGMEQCFCPSPDNECYFCCQTNASESCDIVLTCADGSSECEGEELLRRELPEGASCRGGQCMSGVCQPLTQDLVNRLYSLFTDITISKFFQFLAENIVSTVLFITAVIWSIVGSIVHCYDIRHFREYRKEVTTLEEDRLGHLNEDHLDHTYLDDIAFINPKIDAHQTKRGLSRMGSHHMFPSLPPRGLGLSRQYSIGSGYVPTDRVVHGRRLSTVLEQSKNMDPASNNIMQHVLGAESAVAGPPPSKKKTSPHGPLKMEAVPPSKVKKVPSSKVRKIPSSKKELPSEKEAQKRETLV